MPSLHVTSYDLTAEYVVLSNGQTFDMTQITGNGFNENRLARINQRAQELLDTRTPLTDLSPDDYRVVNGDPNFRHLYWGDVNGNRYSEGAEATHVIHRPILFRLEYDEEGTLAPVVENP